MPFIVRIIIAIAILVLIQFYFTKKTSLILNRISLNIPIRKIKTGKRLLLAILNIYPVVGIGFWIYQYLFPGDYRFPQGVVIDILMIYPFWILFILMLQVSLYYLSSDIIKLLLFPVYRKVRLKWKSIEAKVLLVFLVFFTLFVPFRILFDLNSIQIKEIEFGKKDLHNDLDNFKIALISDIQVDRYTNGSRLNEFISKANAANPDLILIAGDVITSTPDYINSAAENLGKLKAKYGVYACVGDHDNWAYGRDYARSLREVTEALAKQNIPMVDNEKRILEIGNAKIGISFLTNTYVERIPYLVLDSLTNGSMIYDLKIFLTHQPRDYLIRKAQQQKYDLFFAGHTHGGQITLLFPFFNLSPTLIETTFVRGEFWLDEMLMVVTPGLGLSLAPIRYNSTPEVTIITLSAK